MLLEQVSKEIMIAMKGSDKDRLETLRLMKSALMNEKIKQAKPSLTEGEEFAVIAKEVKQRKDSIHEYTTAGRMDLVPKEEVQLAILESYLPLQLSESEIQKIVSDVCVEQGLSTMKDMGKIMATLTPLVKGKADMGLVNRLVKEYLNK